MLRRLIIYFFIFISLCSTAQAGGGITGRVVSITDGDTIRILRFQSEYRIRLEGIDCPEKDQPFGMKAKQFTGSLCYRKNVTIKIKGEDRYGRLLCDVILPDGRILNKELLKAGLAWHYKKYNRDPALAALENKARKAKRGLWSAPNPIPPWLWRHR